MDNFHGLRWETTPHSHSVDFMDLTISIRDATIHTTLYEKALNFYLYIPPQSAHPPGVLNGLIFGNVFRFYTLCSDTGDADHFLRLFYSRLIRRGYKRTRILPIFRRALDRARAGRPPKEPLDPTIMFCHLPFYPDNPSSSIVQTYFKDIVLKPPWKTTLALVKNKAKVPTGIDRMIVAYSRTLNLGNLLSYRKINYPTGPSVSSFLD